MPKIQPACVAWWNQSLLWCPQEVMGRKNEIIPTTPTPQSTCMSDILQAMQKHQNAGEEQWPWQQCCHTGSSKQKSTCVAYESICIIGKQLKQTKKSSSAYKSIDIIASVCGGLCGGKNNNQPDTTLQSVTERCKENSGGCITTVLWQG